MRWLAAVFLAMMALGSTAAAQTADPAPEPQVEEMTAEPRELRAGEAVTLSGSGCAPGNQIRFELRNPDLQSSVNSDAEPDGSFVQTIVLPSTTAPGRTWLRAVCLAPDSSERTMEAVLLVTRPRFLVTWTNILFGIGTALLTAGLGLAMLRPSDRRGSSGRSGKRRRRRRTRSKDHRRSPQTEAVEVTARSPDGPELNGKVADDPSSIEVE